MHGQAYNWNAILEEVGVRHHHLYPELEAANFAALVRQFQQQNDTYETLSAYLIFGAAAVLGREQQASTDALGYHSRLNAKTKAVSLYFWAEEAIAHQQYQTAEGLLAPLLEAYPDDPSLNALVASCCFYSRELARGWAYLNKGIDADPKSKPIISLLCRYLLSEGSLTEAAEAASDLLAIDRFDPVAFNTLSRVAPGEVSPTLTERFEHRALEGSLGPVNSAGVFFDLGRIYEARGEFDRAFDAVTSANACMKSIPSVTGQVFDAGRDYEAFKKQATLFEMLEPCSLPTGLTPVFIVGLPRTGSTLLDQALSAHPATVSIGEDDIMPRIIQEAEALLKEGRITDAQRRLRVWKVQFADHARRVAQNINKTNAPLRYVVDKMLGNSRHLGFLAKLFPEAVFINSCRDLRDVGLSVYFSPLHRANTYATDQRAIGDFMALEAKVMSHWATQGLAVEAIQYETLVDAFELTLHRVMGHIGMTWHEDCLKFHKIQRPVYTYSAHQVRKKLYRQSVARWRHYEKQLQPLIATLEANGLLEKTDTVVAFNGGRQKVPAQLSY